MKRGILALAAIGLLNPIDVEAAAPAPSFSVYASSGSEEAGTIPVKVCKHGTLNASSSTVTLYTIDGTATAAGDYVSTRVVLSFGAGASCQLVPIATRNDAVPEATESFTVKLLKGTNARLYRGTAAVTITDTDVVAPPPPPALPNFSIDPIEVGEDVGTARVTIRRANGNGLASTINYFTANDSAIAPADFAARSGGLTMSATGSSLSFTFPVIDDALVEGHERVKIVVRVTTNGTPALLEGFVTIADNDVAAPPPPPPPPPPGDLWTVAPLVEGGYARARATCSSIYRSAESDRVGIAYPGITAGTVYKVIPGGWGHSPLKSLEGHTGETWTLLAIGEPYVPFGPFITVAAACLEGVKP